MKCLPVILMVTLIFATGAVALFQSGCETSSAAQGPTIDPPSVTLSAGQSQTFTASGGYDYTWSLQTEGVGTLTPRTGSIVVYTAPSTTTNSTASQTITVKSSIQGSSAGTGSTSTTNSSPAYTESATASVKFQ